VAGPAVAVCGVRVAYGSFVVLEDLDLTVADGEIVAVTGVNGAGKSTPLLREGYTGHGGTVVMATHDLDFAAAAGARRMLLAGGRVAAPGLAGPNP